MRCGADADDNIRRAEQLVSDAACAGAQCVLLQELFAHPYFCPQQNAEWFARARPADDNPLIARFAAVARQHRVVLPVSFFERANNVFYNSIAIIDADGATLGVYRKSHLPDGPGYREKFYFTPGDTGFRVWDTAVGRIGVGICWDQWFPESARIMALRGADILLYPTAIGNEPQSPGYSSAAHWRRVMQGHAAANLCALMASNRVGDEDWDEARMTFYGDSFIAGAQGELLATMGDDEGFALADVDLAELRELRYSWGIFRDRRPDLYQPLLSKDGSV